MPPTQTHPAERRGSLRLWPGVALVILQWLLWLLPKVATSTMAGYVSALGALGCGVLVLLWWLLFSRAPWVERLMVLALFPLALWLLRPLTHESIATGGQGFLFFFYAVPWTTLALVLWAVLTRRLGAGARRATLAAAMLLPSGALTLLRTAGVSAEGSDLRWRWSPTAEERLLAQADEVRADASATGPTATAAAWPGFRGPRRDGAVFGARIGADWSASPPVELWRRAIGPGWSSFAVAGDLLYTQEQRGDEEVVAAYRVSSGEPVWRYGDPTRFWESNAGAGPRGTPTLADGRVYTLGATGILNALDAASGALVWSRDAAAEAGTTLPTWGYSGSPLVLGDLVVAAVSGRVAAYDAATGAPRWSGPAGGASYSSAHRMTLDGVSQIVHLSSAGVTGLAPEDGAVLWEHAWPGYPIVQPAVTADGDLLVGVTADSGLRRLAVARRGGSWTAEERWTSRRLKPYFNDFVVHRGHAYGFDGSILACIELTGGERRWKGGRYGNGQLILLADQDLLLVLSEQGELALVGANSERFTELARFRALESKTWNHPALVGDLLLVRSDREMAAFRLPAAGG